MTNLNIAIEASGNVNRKGFSLNLWISETWNNSSLGLKSKYKSLAYYKHIICLTLVN